MMAYIITVLLLAMHESAFAIRDTREQFAIRGVAVQGRDTHEESITGGCFDGPQRLAALQDQAWSREQQTDPLFEPKKASIGTTCEGMSKSCDELNRWGTFDQVALKHGAPFAIVVKQTGAAKQVKTTNCLYSTSGAKCLFPWKYKGKIYNECVPDDDGELRCPTTKPDETGMYTKGVCECKQAKYGVHYSDIGQGSLGNCYFLAALAAIAKVHPDAIEGMFTSLNANQLVFITKWFVGGQRVNVIVDRQIPIKKGKEATPSFLALSRTGEFWPIILEKSWAKIHGSYEAVDGGSWAEAALALTGAPTWQYSFDEVEKESIWELLESATAAKLPMGAGTPHNETAGTRQLGLVTGHAYAVFKAYRRDNTRVVAVFNPWGRNKYKGVLAKEGVAETGRFDMTFDEFMLGFVDLQVLHFHASYKHTSTNIDLGKSEALTFEMTSSGTFYVSLSWPTTRMLRPCKSRSKLPTLIVAKKDNLGAPVIATNQPIGGSLSVEVKLGTGEYVVLLSVALPPGTESQSGGEKAVFTVYAEDKVKLYGLSVGAPELSPKMLLPQETGRTCRTAWHPDYGLFQVQPDKSIGGIATLADDRNIFAYFRAIDDAWLVTKEESRSDVVQGELMRFAQIPRSELQCRSAMEVILEVGPVEDDSPCKKIKVPEKGIFTFQAEKTVGGVPTYASGRLFLYYEARAKEWYTYDIDKWEAVSQGRSTSYYQNFTKERLECTSEEEFFLEVGPVEDNSPCKKIKVPETGIFTLQPGKAVGGLPTYTNGRFFLYYSWNANGWYTTDMDEWDAASQGRSTSYYKLFTKERLECTSEEEFFLEVGPVEDNSPCKKIKVPEKGIFTLQAGKTVRGLPTYTSGNLFLYYYWNKNGWYATGMDKWEAVSQGEGWGSGPFTKEKLECTSEADVLPSEGSGPCPMLLFQGHGPFLLEKGTHVAGIPIYASVNGQLFAFLELKDDEWVVAKREYLSAAQTGGSYRASSVEKKDVKCSDAERAFSSIGPPRDHGRPCSKMFVPGEGVFELQAGKTVGSVPTYWRFDSFVYFNWPEMVWQKVSESRWAEVAQGKSWLIPGFTKDQLQCIHGEKALPLVTPCTKVVTLPKRGPFVLKPSQELGNLPTFESLDGQRILYFAGGDEWLLVGRSHWSHVMKGEFYSSEKVARADMNRYCGCKDEATVIGLNMDVPCKDVKEKLYGGLTCDKNAKYQMQVQTSCPKTCRAAFCD